MKKILLISYYFPPASGVAGLRAASWAGVFQSCELEITVVTRHWQGHETRWTDIAADSNEKISYMRNDGYDIYRLPSKKIWLIRLLRNNLLKIKVFSKFFFAALNYYGYYNWEADANASFLEFLRVHLKEKSYDLLIATSPPLNLIKLANRMNKETGIPFWVDFRDLWNNGYLNSSYRPSLFIKILDHRKKYYVSKWIKESIRISTVSQPIADFLKSIYPKQISVFTNGYDEQLYADKKKDESLKFRFSLVGSYYAQQDFRILFDGLNIFLKKVSPAEFQINLIGISVNEDILKLFHDHLPAEFIYSCNRVSQQEAAFHTINSEVLFHNGWKGYKGIYTTKIFDFIASGNNILIAPGDDDVMDELIIKTNTGKIAKTTEEFISILSGWFEEWKVNGKINYIGNEVEIKKYSRQKIAVQMTKEIQMLA